MTTTDPTQTPLAADGSFEVHLQKSGQILKVSKDQSTWPPCKTRGSMCRFHALKAFAAPA